MFRQDYKLSGVVEIYLFLHPRCVATEARVIDRIYCAQGKLLGYRLGRTPWPAPGDSDGTRRGDR